MKTTLLSFLAMASAALLLPACTSSSTSATRVGSAVKPYPLDTCIVTDNELGSMGEIVTRTYQGQEVKFCCKPCVKKFDANPAKYLAKLPR